MQIAICFTILCLFLSSCGIYKSEFDCPAGKGVGCASVGEVLDMIVEREDGEDLFLKNRGRALLSEREKKKGRNGEKKLEVARSDSGELVLVPEKREEVR